jgi:hypothetical protein
MECERCGSTNVKWIQSNPLERILRVLTGKKRFLCKRCGWSGLGVCEESAPAVTQSAKNPALKLVGVSAHSYRADVDWRG